MQTSLVSPQSEFVEISAIVNVASVPQLSPFRYPGGKTWLVPRVLEWLAALNRRPTVLIDPFTGGGSVPLAALAEGAVDQLILCEIDPDVFCVWDCIFSEANRELCERIYRFQISRESVIRELNSTPSGLVDSAFQTILKNRTYRGGILAGGASLMNAGENGRGVSSRWYPDTLVRRIRSLAMLRSRIRLVHGDGLELIDRYQNLSDSVFFVDPPYTAGSGKRAGRRLYKYNLLDHNKLFGLLSGGVAPVLMTYDDAPEVIELAQRFGYRIDRVPMKNTHHEKKYELLISAC